MESPDKYGPLRAHQVEALNYAAQIKSGAYAARTITAFVSPGGGKNLMSAVFTNELIDLRVIDMVIQVVPNIPLRDQAQQAFTNPARGMKRSIASRLTAQNAESQVGMYREFGYVVTYAALAHKGGRALRRLLNLCKGKRVAVVLDEVHHLCEQAITSKADESEDDERIASADGVQWYEKVRPLVEAARITLLMTGTLSRHDRQRIPFVEYGPDRLPIVQIAYDRRAALTEHAVLPIDFEVTNGRALFERYGRVYDVTINDASAPKARQRSALAALLQDAPYVQSIVREAVDHWRSFCENSYRGRMLVVARRIEDARAIHDFMVKDLGVSTVLATTDQTDAHTRIKKFRERHGDALVTVGMAYEGLDVPDLTHVVFLHSIRSHVWMSQAVERGARFDTKCGVPWRDQRCFVFCPDDVAMSEFVGQMRDQQAREFLERKQREDAAAAAGHPRGSALSTLSATQLESSHLSDDGTSIRGEQMQIVARTRDLIPALRGRPVPEVLRAASLIDWNKHTAAE